MKCTVILDNDREEEIIIYAKEMNDKIKQIEGFISSISPALIGYSENEIVNLTASEVYCFIAEGGKVYAILKNERFRLKTRLYNLEETLGGDFIKINQSCIANTRKIAKFDASISGTLTVIFKNGYKDYVSRRNLKNIKERLGF